MYPKRIDSQSYNFGWVYFRCPYLLRTVHTRPHSIFHIIATWLGSANRDQFNGKVLVWVGGLDSWDPYMKGIVS